MALEYFTEAELRALPQMSSTTTYTSARIDAAAAYFVSIFERFCGVAFIPRTVTDERHDGGTVGITLHRRRPIAASAVTEDGVAVTNTLRIDRGVLRQFSAGSSVPIQWLAGVENVAVTYTHGFSAIPGDVKEAALQATRARLLSTNSNAGVDDRRTSMNTEMGTVNFVIAGENRPTGYPEVDAVLLGYRASRSPLVF